MDFIAKVQIIMDFLPGARTNIKRMRQLHPDPQTSLLKPKLTSYWKERKIIRTSNYINNKNKFFWPTTLKSCWMLTYQSILRVLIHLLTYTTCKLLIVWEDSLADWEMSEDHLIWTYLTVHFPLLNSIEVREILEDMRHKLYIKLKLHQS